jgi:hypothetical protein
MPGNREAEPETRLALVYRTTPLAIALEDVRQDIGRDSFSRIRDSYFRLLPRRGDIDAHLAACKTELCRRVCTVGVLELRLRRQSGRSL